jgi:hypothetical protein
MLLSAVLLLFSWFSDIKLARGEWLMRPPQGAGRAFSLPPGLAAQVNGVRPAASPGGPSLDPGLACRRAIAAASRMGGVPDHLMVAIGRVESGRRGADGLINPWPWSINVEGTDHIFNTREEAIAAVRGYQAMGTRSIDIGCMQVNLLHHPDAFKSLEQGFDPAGNARYAAQLLGRLHAQTGSWEKATAYYHSATPELGEAYQKKVMAVLAEETARDLTLVGPGAFAGSSVQANVRPSLGATKGLSPGMGGGAPLLSNRADMAHIIPQPGAAGRGLDAYRSAPIRVAARKS